MPEDLGETKRCRYFTARGRFPVCSRCRQRILGGLPAGILSAEERLAATLNRICSQKHKLAPANDVAALRKLADEIAPHIEMKVQFEKILQGRIDEIPTMEKKLANQRISTCQKMVKVLNQIGRHITDINAYISGHIVIDYKDARRAATNATRPEWVRIKVMEKYNGKCRYCGSTEDLTIDHALPVFRGGRSEDENLQLLCRVCNSRKGMADKLVPT